MLARFFVHAKHAFATMFRPKFAALLALLLPPALRTQSWVTSQIKRRRAAMGRRGAWLHAFFVNLVGTLIEAVVFIYTAPFSRVTPGLLAAHTLPQIEAARRSALLRCIVLSFGIIAIVIGLALFFLPSTPGIRIANAWGIALCGGCLTLSYSRYAAIASPLFLITGDLWILTFSRIDRSGLSMRTVIVSSAVTILILGAGLLLPYKLIWPTIGALIMLALIQVATLPITYVISPVIIAPRLTAIIYLAIIYSFTALLTWLYVRSTRATLQGLADAYAQVSAIEQQKDAFLHIASHELRAPLAPLILATRLLERQIKRQTQVSPEILKSTEDVITHAKRMNAMVDLLLDLTRIDQQRLLLEIEAYDLTALIRETIQTQQIGARHTILGSGLEDPLIMEIDPRRIWQVMTNLIGNAIKYTPPHTTIHVSVQQQVAGEGTIVTITVTDQGPGITPAAMPHLFDRYYRVEGETRQRLEGWGLGLYVCHAIVVAHDGTITAASTLGVGTTFTVTLPQHRHTSRTTLDTRPGHDA